MSYQALYRKYRPKNLNEVYGQKVAVNILKNAVQNNKFGHAYLFTGSRGCGKTSVAKILARMINCENIKDGIPCGKCNGCLNSESNSCVDILEIDAASNNGVDEIRELKSKVNLTPAVLKYKVYIIDEVHMLTIGAFNALLKTLEEPPEHIVFILATTELYKVPITIVSRCQTLEFKKINNNDMFARLKEISDLEKISITDDAIWEIVNASDGGLRDAIGLLDMATAYTNDKITEEDIYVINGNVSNNEIDYLSDLLIKKELNTSLKIINDYFDTGKDLTKIVEKVIINLKDKMIKENDTNICFIIKNLTDAIDKMKNSVLGKIYLEIAIFNICRNTSDEIVKSNEKLDVITHEEKNIIKPEIEKKEEKSVTVELKEEVDVNNSIDEEFKKIRINNTFVGVNKQSLNEIKDKWNDLNNFTFDKEFGALVCELIDATPIAASNEYLILEYSYDSFVEKGNMYIQKYEDALKKTIDIDRKLIFVTKNEWLEIKKNYIENIKNNVKYNYIEEKQMPDNITKKITSNSKKNSDIIEKANELFDISKIEIKESV